MTSQIRGFERLSDEVVVRRNGRKNNEATYSDVLASREKVLVKVPKENSHSAYVTGHYFRGVYISPHFEHRANIEGNLVQRNIFNSEPEDEGRQRVADVEVRRKITSRGYEVALLDIFLQPWLSLNEADVKLKFETDVPEVPIISGIGVTFEER